jgi:hypothetical protein
MTESRKAGSGPKRTLANLRDDLSKSEALRAEEVIKVVDLEKALAKSEALCAEIVISLYEKDQVISGLRADLARPKVSWKKATAHVEAAIAAHSKKSLSTDQTWEIKQRDELITILRIQLLTERETLKRLRTQLCWVVIVRNLAWHRGYVWGLETFRSLLADDELRVDFRMVDINDLVVDNPAMDELAAIGAVELLDVPNLGSTQLAGEPSLPE